MTSPKITIPLLLLLLVGAISIFQVKQWEQVIVFKFREIEQADYKPGLHVMIPVVNTVQKFEKRLLNLDQEARRFLTMEKKDVLVDYYVKWRITDVEKFYFYPGGFPVRQRVD